MGKTGFQKFTEKALAESSLPPIASPTGGPRERASAVSERKGRGGRPPGKKDLQTVIFLLDPELKAELVGLKDRLHRGSVKDLLVEAVTDLLEKYSDDV